MRRESRTPRTDLATKLERLGLNFHTIDDQPYWDESSAYIFTAEEVETLEKATNQLHEMCLAAVEKIVSERLFSRLQIPIQAHRPIAEAWENDPPAIYGRFDLSYNGLDPPKLLEYNADTPTSLLEAAVIQWHWLQEVEPEADQFNSIWEGLVEKWTSLVQEGYLSSGIVHFGCLNEMEDLMTTAVMMDTASEAGLQVELLEMNQIGWDHDAEVFLDRQFRPIQTLFKLYPWEFILRDKFGPMALRSYHRHQWVEPIWKMVLSNKAILAILWEMFPDHPNLLPTYLDGPREMSEYVKKPFLGREGANVTIFTPSGEVQILGPYDRGGYVFQQYAPLPIFGGSHTVIGSWVIDGTARGIGIRESNGPVTEDRARFVPHYIWSAV